MKTIGLLLYDFQNGGAQHIMIKTANLLSEKYVVKLMVIKNNGPLQNNIDNNVEVVDLRCKRLRSSFIPLIKAINSHKPKYLLTTLLAPSLMLVFSNFFTLSKSKILYREASSPGVERTASCMKKILHMLGKVVLHHTHLIIAVSYGVKEDLIRTYNLSPKKVTVIYNPVFSLNNISIENIVRKKISKTQLSVIFVGRVAKVKRIEIQLQAIAILASKNINVKYTIAGNFPDKEYLLELKTMIKELKLENSVEWLGYVSNISDLLKNHQLLLLTSEYEGLPSVLVEGIISGLNVISCDCPNGAKEILGNNELGVLIDYDACTAKKIAQSILDMAAGNIMLSENFARIYNFSKEAALLNYDSILSK